MLHHGSGSSIWSENIIARPEESSNAFFHDSLDPSVDMIRVLVLEPNSDPDAALCCKLLHVTFGQKPRYEALSYTWGGEDDKGKILIGGKDFQIGRNLYDALIHLRSRDVERSIWIDAVCINQGDNVERSRQVRIMRHIYNRAQAVLVWLGTADLKKETWDMTFNRVGTDHYEDVVDSCEALISEMCSRNYWNRVWIVQEIGKARKIRIHYGTEMVAWDTFIDTVKRTRSITDCVPLKLANQLSQKFTDGHKLENLLRLHENALCKEPRDKVYGFAGLAIDCQDRLPIDYEKPLFEVWKDAVMFKNSDQNAYQSDILQFGRLVKSMLGGPGIAKKEELEREEAHPFYAPLFRNDSTVLKVPVLLRGMIVHLGATYEEFFSSLRKADEWEIALNNKISAHLLPSARAENGAFLELLHELDDADLKRIYNFDRNMSFNYERNIFQPLEREGGYFSHLAANLEHEPICDQPQPSASPTAPVEEKPMHLPTDSSSLQSRLFLLESLEMQSEFPASCMGLVSTVAREGDFICHLYQTDQAIVVRRYAKEFYRLVGTAVIAKDHATAQTTSNDGIGESPKFAVPYVQEPDGSYVVPLYIDLALAYELSL